MTASLNGTTIPSATSITDSGGHVWTVVNGVIYRNGKKAGYSANVVLLLYFNTHIYQKNQAGGWWKWVSGSWNSSSDPRTPVSLSGTTIPSSSYIIDGGHNVWVVSGGTVYENGTAAGVSANVVLLLYFNGYIYQENQAGSWWEWVSNNWSPSSDPRPAPPPSGFHYVGANIAGGEFGDSVPGVLGTDYIYPSHQEIDYYSSKKAKVIRVPFLIERLIHSPGGSFSSQDIAAIDDVINYAATKSPALTVLLDAHDYGYIYNNLIKDQTTYSQLANFWAAMASRYKSNANVWFGLMNEPNAQTASQWLPAVNQSIAAIRNAGANQIITVPGSYWDGGWTWTTSDNAAVIGAPGAVVDPANNFIFEVHQYLDSDGSGTHQNVVSATVGVERLTAITQWAQGLNPMPRLFLGETAVGTDSTGLTALQNMMNYMQANGNVWYGLTFWAGGQWWDNTTWYSLDPDFSTSPPTDVAQMGVLSQFMT
jgi:endoglucanase